METKKELLIIIPAYNEEKTIVNLLQQLEQPEIASIADILVMNDASSDFTNWVVKKRNHALSHMCLILDMEADCSLV